MMCDAPLEGAMVEVDPMVDSLSSKSSRALENVGARPPVCWCIPF